MALHRLLPTRRRATYFNKKNPAPIFMKIRQSLAIDTGPQTDKRKGGVFFLFRKDRVRNVVDTARV